MVRLIGFEPTTFALRGRCATVAPQALETEVGVEPTRAGFAGRCLCRLASQSRYLIHRCQWVESNHRRAGLQPTALPLSYIDLTPPMTSPLGKGLTLCRRVLVAWPGIEPESAGSQPDVLTTVLPRDFNSAARLNFRQNSDSLSLDTAGIGGKWRIRTPSLLASTVFKTA